MRSRPAREPEATGVIVRTNAVISGAAAPATISAEVRKRWRRRVAHGAHQHHQRNGECGANPKRENACHGSSDRANSSKMSRRAALARSGRRLERENELLRRLVADLSPANRQLKD